MTLDICILFHLIASTLIVPVFGTISKGSPNILLILADDVGYSDMGFNGGIYPTPNIDLLASRGIILPQTYVASPLCTPSRSSLMTGKLPIRTGTAGNFSYDLLQSSDGTFRCDAEYGLPSQEKTIAHYFKELSYDTHYIGKWHLGQRSEYLPTKFGFDDYYGLPYGTGEGNFAGEVCYVTYGDSCPPVPLIQSKGDDNYTIIEQPVIRENLDNRYIKKLSDLLAESDKTRPQFIFIGLHQAHITCSMQPYQSNNISSRYGAYRGAIEDLDQMVGRIYATTKQHLDMDNTIVIFTSDNGLLMTDISNAIYPVGTTMFSASYTRSHYSNIGKCSTWEAGLRVPFVISYPDRLVPDKRNNQLTSLMDMIPTLLDLVDANTSIGFPMIDGISISESLINDKLIERPLFLYRGGGLYAIRYGDWKIHYATDQGCDVFFSARSKNFRYNKLLFNIMADPAERFDLYPNRLFDYQIQNVLDIFNELLIMHNKTLNNVPKTYIYDQNTQYSICCDRKTNCTCL